MILNKGSQSFRSQPLCLERWSHSSGGQVFRRVWACAAGQPPAQSTLEAPRLFLARVLEASFFAGSAKTCGPSTGRNFQERGLTTSPYFRAYRRHLGRLEGQMARLCVVEAAGRAALIISSLKTLMISHKFLVRGTYRCIPIRA